MRLEVQSAAEFLMNMLRVPITPSIKAMSEPQLLHFKGSLQTLLVLRYRSHWYPDTPNKGSGYRCIRINSKMDPLVAQAGRSVGCSTKLLSKMLPAELTLWVDPEEVSYRIGENGSICVLYDSQSRSSPSSDSESIGSSSDDLLLDQLNRIDSNQILELMENSNFIQCLTGGNRLNNRLDSSGSGDSSLQSPPPTSPFQSNNNNNNRVTSYQQQQQHNNHHHQQQYQQTIQQHHHNNNNNQQHHHIANQQQHHHFNSLMHHHNGGNSPSHHQHHQQQQHHNNHHHHQAIDNRTMYNWDGFMNSTATAANNKVRTQC